MRRRRARSDSFSISLFPFLAVLICTFGVLIILLVIVVKAADQQSQDQHQAQAAIDEQSIREQHNELDLQLIRVEGLRSLRPGLLSNLQNERTRRAALQAQIQKLSGEIKQINDELAMVSSNTQSQLRFQSNEAIETETQLLESQLAEELSRLESQRTLATSTRSVKYSVVPHDGPDGTHRRPIYIECLQEKLVIQPYGIELTRDDFVEPIVANNPLDAALVAVREYFLKTKLTASDETPYPLLIVRPEGPVSYVVARRAIKSWDEEFGYELIEQDMELDFGILDYQLQQEIEFAIAAARNRQREFVARQLLNRGSTNRDDRDNVENAGGLHASGQFGGFTGADGRIRQVSTDMGSNGQSSNEKKKIVTAGDAESGTGDADTDAKRDADIAVKRMDGETPSLAEHRGQGWALPSKTDKAVAYRRPVKVLVAANELTVEADSRSNRRVRISLDDGPVSAVEDLVQTIWRRIDTWGVAGVGGYWKPELSIVVMPGGETQFRQLILLLQDSGIELREDR